MTGDDRGDKAAELAKHQTSKHAAQEAGDPPGKNWSPYTPVNFTHEEVHSGGSLWGTEGGIGLRGPGLHSPSEHLVP